MVPRSNVFGRGLWPVSKMSGQATSVRSTLRLLLALAVLVGLRPSLLLAGFVSEYSGYTVMAGHEYAHGIVNFAVWKNDPANWDTDWRDNFGIDNPDTRVIALANTTVQKEATYVIFYQLVNERIGGKQSYLDEFTIYVSPGLVTSVGYIDRYVFGDSEGNISIYGSDENPVIGTDPSESGPYFSVNDDDTPWDGEPSAKNRVPNSSFVKETFSAIMPSSATIGADTVTFFFFSPTITTKYESAILWITTDAPFIGYAKGLLGGDGTGGSDGDVPVPTPEPGSLVLTLLAAVAFPVVRRVRVRSQSQEA